MAGNVSIDFAGTFQIRAQRFFQHDADVGGIEPDGGKMFAGGGKEFGGGGKIDDDAVGVLAGVYGVGKAGKVFGAGYVQRLIPDAGGEGCPFFFAEILFDVDAAFGFGFGEILGGVQRAAGYAEDAAVRIKQPCGVRLIKGGQQFSHGQIAGCAEQDKVKIRLGHGCSLSVLAACLKNGFGQSEKRHYFTHFRRALPHIFRQPETRETAL